MPTQRHRRLGPLPALEAVLRGLRSPLGRLVLFGLILEAALIAFRLSSRMDRTRVSTVLFFFLPFGVFVLLLVVFKCSSLEYSRRATVVILVFTVLFSSTFLADRPSMSDDVYRYYWDGKVVNSGLNPYVYAPDAEYLASLRDENWVLINNKDLATPYPPVLELLFAAIYRLSPTMLVFKLVFTGIHVAAALVLLLLTRKIGTPPAYALIYAWNPLLAVEFGHSGHNDSFAVLLMLLALRSVLGRRNGSSAVILAAATLSKMFPGFLAPFFALKWKVRSTILFLLTVGSPYMPLALLGPLQTSIPVYFERIAFNGSIYYIAEEAMNLLLAKETVQLSARVFISLIFLMTLVAIAAKSRSKGLVRSSYLAISSYLVLSPTVEPWYLSWVLPFAAVYASWPWVYLSGAVFLSYLTYTYPAISPGFWPEQWWVRALQYIPFGLILLLGYLKRHRPSVLRITRRT